MSKNIKKLKIPDKSGVYIFKKKNQILYIGKATSLRDRVKSYMSKGIFDMRGPLIEKMVQEADKIDWQITDSVLEAIILEANLIKKHQPKYNTKEKSDKSFLCVVITKELMPQVLTVRARNLDRHSDILKNMRISKIYGPFTNGVQLREAMKIIRRIFPFIDAQSVKRNNFEFYRQLGLTPDTGNKELQLAYKKNITNLKLFFEGKKKKIIFNLKKEMFHYANNKEFEHANEIKKRIFALQHINDISLIKDNLLPRQSASSLHSSAMLRIEAYDIAHLAGRSMVGVMTVVQGGEPNKNEYRKFKIRTQATTNDTGALMEVIERRFAHTEWRYPNIIVVDGGKAQINACKKVLKKVGVDVPVLSVLKDERHKPKYILGDKVLAHKYERELLLANSEAHRFAIAYHKKMRNKNFLQ